MRLPPLLQPSVAAFCTGVFFFPYVAACAVATVEPLAPRPIDLSTPYAEAGAPPLDAAVAADVEPPSSVDGSSAAPWEGESDDPKATHKDKLEDLLALFDQRERYLDLRIGHGPGMISQGNRAESHHAISRRACLRGLSGVTLQTSEQRARCGGMENMVPVFSGGDPASAKFCIDIFEFPNRACELPMVWVRVTEAKRICEAQGKRLCDQDEWNLSCRGDPAGAPDRVYAYGDELDLSVCNTNKSRKGRKRCGFGSMQEIFSTCGTDTEPSGSFPQCRSRFGVYDQHGNVAEIMTRTEAGVGVMSQLKGSASFYVDVARKPNEWHGGRSRYADHCNFDPRWHVERIETAGHFNYHLGFRCCKTLAAK